MSDRENGRDIQSEELYKEREINRFIERQREINRERKLQKERKKVELEKVETGFFVREFMKSEEDLIMLTAKYYLNWLLGNFLNLTYC